MHNARQNRRFFLGTALALAASTSSFGQATADTATMSDTADGGGRSGAAFFMVTAVNGSAVQETALSLSTQASLGRGPFMVAKTAKRPIPAGRVELQLRGLQSTAAPIDTLFRSLFKGGNPEVVGAVTVEIAAGQFYRATGVLDAYRREIWIEDERGVEVPGSRLTASADPALLKDMEGAAFVTTNVRYEGDWISDAPLPQLPFIPLGARLKVTDWGSNRATVLVDGRKMRMGIDWARGRETIQQFVGRITSAEDPRPKLAGLPELTRDAIRSGRVLPGMTREHVLQALGRPRVDLNPSLDAPEWMYHTADNEELFLVFDDRGLLKDIDGSRKARSLVRYEMP